MPIDDNDDTLITGKQASEDAAMAQVEAGLVPGLINVSIGNEAEFQAAQQTLVNTEKALVFFRIPRSIAEDGEMGGRALSSYIVRLPESVHGSVILSFDGWADDPRELFEIPIVVEFCQGLIMGEALTVEEVAPHARKLFTVLMDEVAHAFDAEGNLVAPTWMEYSGQIWLLNTSDPIHSYTRINGRIMRDVAFAMYLRDHLIGEQESPNGS